MFVVGLPCSGKSSLAHRLSVDLGLQVLAKDEIKERLFETLGFSDRAWSEKLGGASFDLLYWSMEKLLAAGASFIVDADFSDPDRATRYLAVLMERYPFRSLQVSLFAPGDVLFERFRQRSTSGERHPGHVDHLNFQEFKPALMKGKRERLDLSGETYEVDTSDFSKLNYEQLLATVKGALGSEASSGKIV